MRPTKDLFADFPALDAEPWEQLIKKELKGKDPASIAVPLPDGSVIRPFAFGQDRPGMRRGVKRGGNAWRMCVQVNASDPDANDRLLEDLMGGMDGAVVHGDRERLPDALKDVLIAGIDLQVRGGDPSTLVWLLEEGRRQGVADSELYLCAGLDPDTDLAGLLERIQAHPFVRLFDLRADDPSLEATSSMLEQGRRVLQRMLDAGFPIDQAAARVQFTLPLGDDLFLEAARLRAVPGAGLLPPRPPAGRGRLPRGGRLSLR